jgi:hypothetical protein
MGEYQRPRPKAAITLCPGVGSNDRLPRSNLTSGESAALPAVYLRLAGSRVRGFLWWRAKSPAPKAGAINLQLRTPAPQTRLHTGAADGWSSPPARVRTGVHCRANGADADKPESLYSCCRFSAWGSAL